MSYLQGRFPIVQKENLARNCFSFVIHCPEAAAAAQPGQFVHLRVEGFSLRRPISICEIDSERGNLRLVFEIRGKGTQALARLNEGDLIDLIGPLGRGFTFSSEKDERVILIGGGIGTPPMLELARRYSTSAIVILGFRSAAAVILQEDFLRTGAEVLLCTDDGSAGQKGFVTQALSQRLDEAKSARESVRRICACGPMAMLKGTAALAEQYQIPCEVSLEERMGCGVGACLVCACKTVKDGREIFSHVCKDGPVFPAEEVLF